MCRHFGELIDRDPAAFRRKAVFINDDAFNTVCPYTTLSRIFNADNVALQIGINTAVFKAVFRIFHYAFFEPDFAGITEWLPPSEGAVHQSDVA